MLDALRDPSVFAIVKIVLSAMGAALSLGFTIGLALLKVGGMLRKELDKMRSESEGRNRRLHQRIDDFITHSDVTYVRKDVHEADVRGIMHAVEEYRTVATHGREGCKEAAHV